MTARFTVFAIAMFAAASVAVADTDKHVQTNKKEQQQAAVPLPKDAKLLATVETDSIHVFPELQKDKKDAKKMVDEKLFDVAAVDMLYQSSESYKKLVSFFDSELTKSGEQELMRTEIPSATAWMVKNPQGNIATLIVRNTKPATIETVQAAEAAGDVQERR